MKNPCIEVPLPATALQPRFIYEGYGRVRDRLDGSIRPAEDTGFRFTQHDRN